MEAASEKINGAWSNVQKEAASALGNIDMSELKEMSGHLADEAALFVKRHPLACVAGGVAVGFVLGMLVAREGRSSK
jgi:ElaB/YqjD/DUF883 family membrane-anchored ribosome-binding protein